MIGRCLLPLLLTGVATASGCGWADPVRPTSSADGGSTRSPSMLMWVRADPTELILLPGERGSVGVVAFDQYSGTMSPPPTLAYASDAPEIATVSHAGVVTAVAPGATMIRLTATSGERTSRTEMWVAVLQPSTPGEVLLKEGPLGWQPRVAEAAVGDVVRWAAGPVGWGGTPHTVLHLFTNNHGIDSLDLRGGTATLRLTAPDTIQYCSGACWDPPDFGAIIVR